MTRNYIETEKLAKNIYTKDEIFVINKMHWAFVTRKMLPFNCWYISSGQSIKKVAFCAKGQKAELLQAMDKRAKELRKKITPEMVAELRKEEAEIKAAARKREAEERKARMEENSISEMISADGQGHGFMSILHNLNNGTHYKFSAGYAKENGVEYSEDIDWDGYSKSCRFPMINRYFRLNVRRGYHIFIVGGLITFIKGGKIDRNGMACEWIEQGKAISDIKFVKGYLVRGEHIEAKSLKAAQAINAEKRAMQLARILSARKKATRREEQKANGTLKITFNDSINSGNCRPGTMEFKNKYEAAIGHEATSISIADLRKYGKEFGVEYYAERAIQYALNH